MRLLTLSNVPLEPEQGSGYVVLGYAAELRRLGCSVDLLGPEDLDALPVESPRAIRHRIALGMARESLAGASTGKYDVIEIFGGESWIANFAIGHLFENRRFLLIHRSNGLETHVDECLRASVASVADRFRPDPGPAFERSLREVDAIVTVSEWDARWARERPGLATTPVVAIENPLPASLLNREISGQRQTRIVYCGAWTRVKGIDLLKSGLPPVLRSNPDWTLHLVGVPANARAEFPGDVRNQVFVSPFLERESSLRQFFASASILVLTSLYESFGLVVAEALASGCAVVATQVGFAAGLEDGQQVLHCHDHDSLAQAVQRLISDDSLRRRLSINGWQRVQTLRWPTAAEKLLSLYRGLLPR